MNKSKKALPFGRAFFFAGIVHLLHFRTEITLAEDIDPNDHLKSDDPDNPLCSCL